MKIKKLKKKLVEWHSRNEAKTIHYSTNLTYLAVTD